MRKLIIPALMMLALASMLTGIAMADDIHLCASLSNCPPGGSSVVPFGPSTSAWVSSGGASPAGGELFVAILVPVANTSGGWNSNSVQLWSLLGVLPGQTFPNLNSALSQECTGPSGSCYSGFTPGSFNVSDLDLGAWTGSPQSITLPSEPIGTLFVAFNEINGQLDAVSPWSSSLVNAPEPSSLLLLGIGLAGALALKKALA